LVEVYVVVKSPSRFAMLDEPFTHLSPLQVEKVKELLLQEKQQKGFLVTDHMYHQVLDICDDLYVLFKRENAFDQNRSRYPGARLCKILRTGARKNKQPTNYLR
jgi:ABC-type lipopolysaccharide export system ATPase subunit